MLIFDSSVGINGKGGGNGAYGKERCQRAIKGAVAILRPRHAVRGDKLSPFRLVLVEAHGENHQRLPLKLLRDLLDARQGLAARTAPCGPEVDENDFARKAVERNALPVERGDGKAGLNQPRKQTSRRRGSRSAFRPFLPFEVCPHDRPHSHDSPLRLDELFTP